MYGYARDATDTVSTKTQSLMRTLCGSTRRGGSLWAPVHSCSRAGGVRSFNHILLKDC